MENKFDDALHALTLSEDGSYTAFSKEYDEHYHSTKDGALKESYVKHVLPAFNALKNRDEVCILDICFGLGFNTLCTILHYRKSAPKTKLKIFSPELDADLVKSLANFTYPKEFDNLKNIILHLSQNSKYEDEYLFIEIYLGDAREYIKRFHNIFDIVYQDAFSPSTNPALWTKEYFSAIQKAIKSDGILTTYSIAFKTRLALYENGFHLYLNEGEGFRSSTVASQMKLENYKLINMEHKISCNIGIKALSDLDV